MNGLLMLLNLYSEPTLTTLLAEQVPLILLMKNLASHYKTTAPKPKSANAKKHTHSTIANNLNHY
jgi:hypothetical protein